MERRAYIFVGKPPYSASAYEFGDRERKELSEQSHTRYTQHLFDRIVSLCLQAGYPRFTAEELIARRGPRIELTV